MSLVVTEGQSLTVTGNLVGANVLATNETRLAALEVLLDKFIGFKTEAQIALLDTSAYTGGEFVISTDGATAKFWSVSLGDWV